MSDRPTQLVDNIVPGVGRNDLCVCDHEAEIHEKLFAKLGFCMWARSQYPCGCPKFKVAE